jgi:hypothetical protein
MADENEGELQTAAEITAARREFLNNPPAVIEPEAPSAEGGEQLDENALLDDLTTPPAGTEGAVAGDGQAAPAPAPAPPGAPDPYAAFGGEEAVRTAHEVQQAMRTAEGVRALVANGLVALGYSVEQVRAALDAAGEEEHEEAAPTGVDPFAGLDDEDIITVAQVRPLLESIAADAAARAVASTQQQLEPVAQSIQAQQQTQVRATTDTAIIEVLGPVPTDPKDIAAYRTQVDALVQRGTVYYDPNQWTNPAHIREAIQRAHAEITSENEARWQAYLHSKRQTRDSQPANIGGGAGGEGALPEPKNLKEAREQAKAAGFFS